MPIIAGASRQLAGRFFDKGAAVYNIKHPDFGAKVDAKEVVDSAVTSGSPTLSSMSAGFTAADVGKIITVAGAGAAGGVLSTSILGYVNAITVTLAASASTTVTAALTNYGTDDTAAVLAAKNAAKAAGGGVIWVPDGTALCNTITHASGLSWILDIDTDNITFDGPGTLKTTAPGSLFYISGAGKPVGMANWATYDLPNGLNTHRISSAAKADMSVTCTTPAQAGNFAPKDIIYIRTGQTLTNAGANQPDSELNEVVSANTNTGVILLRYPLAKAYAPQNYPLGHPNAGTPAPFGIARVTDRVISNIELRNIGLVSTDANPLIIGGSIIGLRYRNLNCQCNGAFQSQGNYRSAEFAGNKIKMNCPTTYLFSTATGTSDVHVHDNQGSNVGGLCFLHIHEGSARVNAHDNLLQGKANKTSDVAVSIRAVAHDINVHDNTLIVHGAISTVIYVNAGSGGLYESTGSIKNNRIVAPGLLAYSTRVADASGWKVDGNDDLIEGAWVEEGSNIFGPIDRIFLGAQQLTGFFGSAPASAIIQNRFQSITMPNSVTTNVGALVRVPKYWKSWKIYIWWTNPTAAAGNVYWQSSTTGAADGTDLSVLANLSRSSGAVAAPAQWVLKRTEQTGLGTWIRDTNVDPIGKLVAVWASRAGADANDTLAANASLIGIEVVRIK